MSKFVIAALFALLAVASVNAAVFSVTRLDDPTPGSCTPVDCSLREAVLAANEDVAVDTINLLPGVHLIDFAGGVDNTEESGDLDIETDMILVGADSTIDGQLLGRMIDIRSDANVTMTRITLRNGNSTLATNNGTNGGALSVGSGSLTMREVVVTDNVAQSLGGGVYAYDGAVVLIEDCVFSNNQAGLSSSLSGSGAGLFASTGVTVRDTTFDNNESNSTGGAIYLSGPMADNRLERVTLTNNTSGSTGGAIWFTGSESSLFIDRMIATGNMITGNSNGGALAVPNSDQRRVQITNSVFDGNEARSGGAITFPGQTDSMSIDNSLFLNNVARDNGGALHVNGGIVDVTNVTFSDNDAADDGGALFTSGNDTSVSLVHTTIADGTADQGSAVYMTGVTAEVRFANNIISGDCDTSSSGNLVSSGGNVEGPGDTCMFDTTNDLASQDMGQLGLQPLADNGGGTQSQQLSMSSVAIGNGLPAICGLVGFDQRYAIRGALCDSGSVEAAGVADDLIFRYDNED